MIDDEQRWAAQAEIGRWMFDNAMQIPLFMVNAVWPLGPELDAWEPRVGTLAWLNKWEHAPHRQ